ncbi:MAG TPA: hypothetical protein ENI23_09000 [bacterium]|nr:hypothetical protein [bacterium]
MGRTITIQELEEHYYGASGVGMITKSDDPVLSSTTGVYNVVFGKFVWATFNQEANTIGILPKTVWDNSGWRLQTARAGSSADGGVAEGGAVPETIKPTFLEVTNTLKTVAHTFETSEHQDYFVAHDDDAIGDLQHMRMIMGTKHKEAMNQALLRDVGDQVGSGGAYAGIDGFETIDRVISSDSEEDAFGGGGSAYYDIFGLDRDTATTFDSTVSHNSGSDRALSDSLIRTMIYDIKEDGGNTQAINTGYDTARTAIALYSDQVRYNVIGEAKVQVGVNGIQTEAGIDVGIRISTIYQIPMIESKDVPKDTISRMFFIDTSDPEGSGKARLSLDISHPTQYFQAGVSDGSPFITDTFTTKGLYRTNGEIRCTSLQSQGKIRDLS